MISDILTVAWKEWKEFVQQERTRRVGPLRALLFVAIGGIFIGWELDPNFGRSWLTVFLTSFLAVMFVTTVVPDSFAGERERHTLETLLATRLPDPAILLGKVGATVSYGWAIALAVLPTGILASNLFRTRPVGEPIARLDILLLSSVSSLLAGLLIAGAGVLISLRAATARQAHQHLGLVVTGLFLTPAIAISAVPVGWRMWLEETILRVGVTRTLVVGYAILLLVNAVLLGIALLRFQRARLIF